MSFRGFSEFIEQAMSLWAALEALRAVMAILFCVALATFVVYLIGVWRLCRAEDRPKKIPAQRMRIAPRRNTKIQEEGSMI